MKWNKITKSVGLAAVSLMALFSLGAVNGNAEKVINQHSSALATYSGVSHRYHDVYNKNTTTHYDDYSDYNGGSLKSKAGKYANFKPYMNIDNINDNDSESPQSIVVTPNHHIFIAYNDYGGHMHVDRFINNGHLKVGKTFAGGHGQSMTYNFKNHEIWLIGNKSGKSVKRSNVQEISQASLKPLRKIKFKFGQSIISSNLAFDKHGNAYTYTITGGGFAPAGSVKLYKGKITNHSIHFHLIMQGIRHAPGETPQAMSYNPKNNRLYLVSDGEFISFPANKIGHLKKRDVHYTKFPGHIEFEGLAFDKSGRGYLLVHGEVLRSTRALN